MANRFCGCFVWALAPFCLLFLVWPFASLFPLAKRKSGWGICGLVGCWVFLVCCFNRFAVSMDSICPCTNVFPAYSHVRTEPLARHRPHSREKKICLLPGSPSLLPSSGRMRARIMTLMLRVCSMLAKHHIQESGLPQPPHNTCQPLWRAYSVRRRLHQCCRASDHR